MSPYRALFAVTLREHRNVVLIWLGLLVGVPLLSSAYLLARYGFSADVLASVDSQKLTAGRLLGWYALFPLVAFWGGWSVHARSRRVRSDVWFRTIPVSDGAVAALTIGAGLLGLAFTSYAHFAVIQTLEALLGARSWWDALRPGWDVVFLFSVLAPFCLAGALGAWLISRGRTSYFPLVLSIAWVGLMIVVWITVGVILAGSENAELLARVSLDPSRQPAILVGHLLATGVLGSILWQRASRVEILF